MWMYVRQAPPHAETAAIRPRVIWITASAFRQVISVAACTVLHYAAPLLLLLLLLLSGVPVLLCSQSRIRIWQAPWRQTFLFTRSPIQRPS
jgi:hypothetical protein